MTLLIKSGRLLSPTLAGVPESSTTKDDIIVYLTASPPGTSPVQLIITTIIRDVSHCLVLCIRRRLYCEQSAAQIGSTVATRTPHSWALVAIFALGFFPTVGTDTVAFYMLSSLETMF